MERQPNRLIHETSPYLLQHAHNPVDWWPWSDEAFASARERDLPVFLSIGYSACHWCHVMERESFEDASVAAVLNENFVPIKVDREERPDVDSIYMHAVQMMTGHGGWPMSVFLTPEGAPFFGGTYFPPDDRHGLPSFRTVLTQLAEAWHERRGELFNAAGEIRKAIAAATDMSVAPAEVTLDELNSAARHIASGYDATWGGFGSAPKFPPSMSLSFLMQVAHRTHDRQLAGIVTHTLNRMALGGIFDQIGGGFHRYSTDSRWLVPHFEKMLYDNALLTRLYLRAWQWTKEPLYASVARETLAFVEREMTSPEGAFYSTLDADSEGVEGKFYVWSRDEVLEILGEDDGRIFAATFEVSGRGNWEGVNILHVPRDFDAVAADLGVTSQRHSEIVRDGKAALARTRETRIRPGRDEKVLAGWNGWMLAAFAEATLAFDSEDFRDRAIRSADFLLDRMIVSGKLRRSWKDGVSKIDGLLEDYGGVIWGLVATFEATQRRNYLDQARELAREAVARFGDREDGGFWDSPSDGETLITRPRDVFDNATPSGNSLLIASLLRLAIYYDDPELSRRAGQALRSLWPIAKRYPSGFGFLLGEAAEWVTGTPREIAVTGPSEDTRTRTLVQVVGESFLPARVLATSPAGDLPLLQGKPPDRIAAWVCENYRCLEPIEDPEELRALLE